MRCLVALAIFVPLLSAQPASDFFQDTFDQMLRNDPEYATATGHHEYGDRWTDWSKAGRDQRRRFLEQRLEQLKTATLGDSAQDLLTKRVVRYDFESRLEAWDLETHLLRLGQLRGFHNAVYNTIDQMPSRSVADYEKILGRLRGLPVYVDQNIAILDEAIASGLVQPALVANIVIGQVNAQKQQDAEHTELLKAFRNFPASVPEPDRQRLRKDAGEAYHKSFLPAWTKLHNYLVASYLPHVRSADSLSSMKDGHAAYTILIHRLTTTTMSAAEIHTLGEQEVARTEAAMAEILKEVKFTGTIPEFQKKMDADPAQHFQSKEEMLAYCRNIAKTIEPALPNQFRHIPALLYGVRPIPPDREAAEATNAQGAAPDLSKPGWFNLNTYLPEKQVRYDKESLVLHEAIPGHIYQGAVAVQQTQLPDLRRFYTNSAFGEGWALYVESLGAQLGVYRDPYSRFGQLASERFRAVRLVVDTGIHASGWTREQAVEYFQKHSPQISMAEVDRYISWPAQALSYKVGELRIRSLRAKAEKELGARFDVRDFNDAVILDGRLPLDLLSERIEQFISKTAQ